MLHHYFKYQYDCTLLPFLSLSLFPAPSDTIRSEEIIWLERQPRNDSRNPILGSVEVAATNACNNEVITAGTEPSS